jgi:4-amino-4-deoxy-L-arabinose transferase-like glycosyltransferase
MTIHRVPDQIAVPNPTSRGQKYLLIAVVFVGIALRFEGIHESSLSQYDEGVYVYNGIGAAFGAPLSFNFDLPLHAPPGFPWSVALVCWLLQFPWPAAGVVVSSLAGVATIPVVFLIARRLAGNYAGLGAASLVCTSDLHIAYSRMALTDVPMTLLFTLAVYSVLKLSESLSSLNLAPANPAGKANRWTLAVAAASALAWNTKYNGWMPIAVSLVAAFACFFRPTARLAAENSVNSDPSQLRQMIVRLITAGGLAALCFLPWYLFVERNFPGGYAAVTDHHRTYVGNLTTWHLHLWQHIQALAGYRHYGWAIAATALAATMMLLTARAWRSGAGRSGTVMAIVALAGSLGMIVAGVDVMLILIAAGMASLAFASGRFADLLVASWAITFLVAVPIYHPYTRLLVPLVPAVSCLTAACLARLWRRFAAGSVQDASFRRPPEAAALAFAALACLAIGLLARPYGLIPSRDLWERWSAKNSYRAVTDVILNHTEEDAFVICQAQPTLALYVPRERIPIGNVPFTQVLDQLPNERPCYLALDFFWLHAQPERDALDTVMNAGDRLELVATVDNDVNIVTLGDFLTPAQIARKLAAPDNPPDRSGVPSSLTAGPKDHIAIFAIRGNK